MPSQSPTNNVNIKQLFIKEYQFEDFNIGLSSLWKISTLEPIVINTSNFSAIQFEMLAETIPNPNPTGFDVAMGFGFGDKVLMFGKKTLYTYGTSSAEYPKYARNTIINAGKAGTSVGATPVEIEILTDAESILISDAVKAANGLNTNNIGDYEESFDLIVLPPIMYVWVTLDYSGTVGVGSNLNTTLVINGII
jgi:hypothetical protein